MKYSKWKAVEITRCVKNGITPTPGPPEDMGGEASGATGFGPGPSSFPPSLPGDASTSYYGAGDKPIPKPRHNMRSEYPEPGMGGDVSSLPPQDPPGYGFHDQPDPVVSMGPGTGGGATGGAMAAGGTERGVASLGPEEIAKAQKLFKFASSALDYEDVDGAVDYLQKALKLLTSRD